MTVSSTDAADDSPVSLSDADFAKVLNHLDLMSRGGRFDDVALAEGLIRAGVVLLTIHGGGGPETRTRARDMMDHAFAWTQRMVPEHQPRDP
ncbi:MAG: hypothetical protein WCO00_07830 [Rhodospirillaceae bacterium]